MLGGSCIAAKLELSSNIRCTLLAKKARIWNLLYSTPPQNHTENKYPMTTMVRRVCIQCMQTMCGHKVKLKTVCVKSKERAVCIRFHIRHSI